MEILQSIELGPVDEIVESVFKNNSDVGEIKVIPYRIGKCPWIVDCSSSIKMTTLIKKIPDVPIVLSPRLS